MLKLYGFSVSNYYNKVKFALLEKNIPFREELVYPNNDEAFLGRTPMGKVPFIETGDGSICESQVIIEYLEDIHPAPPLYPANPHQAAKCRELIQFIELHLELVARRLYGEVFFYRKVADEVKEEVQQRLQKGAEALTGLVKFAPYIAGDMFTYADCAAFAHLPMVAHASKVIYGKNVLDPISGVAPYLKQIGARPHAQKVMSDREAALPAFMALIKKRA